MRPTGHLLPIRSLCSLSIFVIVPFALATTGDPEDIAGQQILGKYLEAKQTQQAALRGVQMEVDIDANLPKQQKNGKLHALRSISRLGKITYKGLGFSGDSSVKSQVIARYL